MSEEAIKSILSEREKKQFTSLRDFILRTDVNQRIIENIIKVGGFDSLDNRENLLKQVPKLIKLRSSKERGINPLIEDRESANPEPEATTYADMMRQMLMERELLSLELSAHPLDFCAIHDKFTKIRDLRLMHPGKAVNIAGSVIRYQTPPTRNGNRVVYVIMEDGTGIADVIVFSDVQEKYGHVLFREGWLSVKGKIQKRGPKAISVIAEELTPLLSKGQVVGSIIC